MNEITKTFNDTVICEIYIERVIEKWNHLWFISRWHEEYTLCKQLRINSKIMQIKMQISEHQAKELIEKLHLSCNKSLCFNNAWTYR